MTIYQQELLRLLSNFNCAGRIDEKSGVLHVSMDGLPLCTQERTGALQWKPEDLFSEERKEAFHAICDASASIREYVSLYESSPPMRIESIKEYRMLAEYGDTILGGMYSEPYGFMFSTWKQDKARGYAAQGDYTRNYDQAKESFITRSGLMNKNRIFSEEDAANLYRCISFAQENCGTLTYEQEQQLGALLEKLTYGYPQLEDQPPAFDPDEGMQLNM